VRLLIVEDDDRAATYLARGLTESGHIVDRAADGELGLALASEGIYDALIVDRRLPILDGLSLIRQLRESDALTPILVLSAIGSSADRVEGTTSPSPTPFPKSSLGSRRWRDGPIGRGGRRCCGSATWSLIPRAGGCPGRDARSDCSTGTCCCWPR
jgi:CheY-like chemotaxis protein